MTHPSLPDLLTVIVQARQTRGADQARHLERAENMARGMLGHRAETQALCIHDSAPCVAECTANRSLRGRCGRGL
jgi:hypothetical protein